MTFPDPKLHPDFKDIVTSLRENDYDWLLNYLQSKTRHNHALLHAAAMEDRRYAINKTHRLLNSRLIDYRDQQHIHPNYDGLLEAASLSFDTKRIQHLVTSFRFKQSVYDNALKVQSMWGNEKTLYALLGYTKSNHVMSVHHFNCIINTLNYENHSLAQQLYTDFAKPYNLTPDEYEKVLYEAALNGYGQLVAEVLSDHGSLISEVALHSSLLDINKRARQKICRNHDIASSILPYLREVPRLEDEEFLSLFDDVSEDLSALSPDSPSTMTKVLTHVNVLQNPTGSIVDLLQSAPLWQQPYYLPYLQGQSHAIT